MSKRLLILTAALLLLVLFTQVQDYLSKTDLRSQALAKDQIDYYLTNFDLMAVAEDGQVSYQIHGSHLSHWQGRQQSLILAPVVKTHDGTTLQADLLWYDRASNTIHTDAAVTITTPSGTMQSTGLTAQLDQEVLRFENRVRSTYRTQ